MRRFSQNEDTIILNCISNGHGITGGLKSAAKKIGRTTAAVTTRYYGTLRNKTGVPNNHKVIVTNPMKEIGITKFNGKINVNGVVLEGEFSF